MGRFDREAYVNSDTILDHIHCITSTVSKHEAIKDPVCDQTAVTKPSGTYFSQMVLTSLEDLSTPINNDCVHSMTAGNTGITGCSKIKLESQSP